MNERQRSCTDNEGKLIYPWMWQCTKCREWYNSQSLAKYCCIEKGEKEMKEKICRHCKGIGMEPHSKDKEYNGLSCLECNGRGTITED